MAMSFDTLRVGKRYYLKNYGERAEFQIQASTGDNDYIVKDLLSLETYRLSELVKYGKGDDYELYELEKE